jgi:hypothetical protein
VTDTFILKRINGASIGNALECRVKGVRETWATGKCIFTENAAFRYNFSTGCVSLNAHHTVKEIPKI